MILIFGGTSDSLQLCKQLGEIGEDYTISVTTGYGKALSLAYTENVLEGKLTEVDMHRVIKEKNVDIIIDATHPYALEVSQNAMSVARDLELPYIRYERASLLDEVVYDKLYYARDTREACEVAQGLGDIIFLGTGSKTLGEFIKALPNKKIIARVLPTSEVIASCEALGLSPEHIVAMKGPFTREMNEVLYKNYNIDCMITKESGAEGGFLEKIHAAMALGISVIVIKRAKLDYPKVTCSIEEVLQQVKEMRK